MKSLQRQPDWALVIMMAILVVFGLVMMISSSSVNGFSEHHDGLYYVKRHALYIVCGLIAGGIALFIPYQSYKRIAFPGLIVATVLIGLTFVPPIGFRAGGAFRWLNMGFIQFQPVEIVKFFITVFIANSLQNKGIKIKNFRHGVLPIILVLLVPIAILLKQPDLGNVILITGISGMMLFLSPMNLGLMLGGILSFVGVVLINVLTHPYQMVRIKTFLDPWADPLGKSYHIIQSMTAIGSGGFWGLGIGQSKMKYFYLPLHYSDFIFSIICEEGGFLVASVVIVIFVAFFLRGFHIAKRSPDRFGFYLAIGLTGYIVFQALINIGVVIGLFPTKGIPLTFISFGGTSLVISIFFTGVIANIYRFRQVESSS